ncbi:MAG: threonine/serine exporter family protein [Oscillospiraceae bacterium]
MSAQKQVLQLCVDAGVMLLQNGAEVFRVQETMERIAKAYHAENFHVYVLTNGIFASIDDEGSTVNSEIRHIPFTTMHMGRIAALNDLSRNIESGKVSAEAALEDIKKIDKMPYSSALACVLACGVGAACFAYIFGGTVWDAASALCVGVILQLFLFFVGKYKLSRIIINIMASAVCAACSYVLFALGMGTALNHIIIGAIIPLVPGMALTMSIRDFANGDYLSGAIRLIDALLVGGCIAIGVGAVLMVLSAFTGVRI